MNKKVFLIVGAMAVSLLAQKAPESSNLFRYLMKQREASGALSGNVQARELNMTGKTLNDTFLDTVISYDIQKNAFSTRAQTAQNRRFAMDNVALEQKRLEELRRLARKNRQTAKKPKKIFRATGYCTFANDVNIEASNEYSMLDCSLKIGNRFVQSQLFAGLYPDYKREMLIALPIYVKIGDNRYPAKGVILNAQMTSMNVANYVDRVRIRRLLAKSLLVTSDVAYNQASAYLKAVEESKKQEQIAYTTQTNPVTGAITQIPITITNTQKPDKRTYWQTGIVELTSKLINLFGKDYLSYLKPFYKVKAGSAVYADIIFKKDMQTMYKTFESVNKTEMDKIEKNNQAFEAEKTKY